MAKAAEKQWFDKDNNQQEQTLLLPQQIMLTMHRYSVENLKQLAQYYTKVSKVAQESSEQFY